jgi:hypothetical protein
MSIALWLWRGRPYLGSADRVVWPGLRGGLLLGLLGLLGLALAVGIVGLGLALLGGDVEYRIWDRRLLAVLAVGLEKEVLAGLLEVVAHV